MNTTSVNLQTLSYRETRTYLIALLFIAGNVILPQLCHLMPQGGLIWLPIYFFTLVGAYRYGWRVGLLTAILSPLVNSLAFGMPALAALPIIETKSIILAAVAGLTATRFNRISLPLIAAVVIVSQLIGGTVEWAYTGSLMAAAQDFRIGFPGILTQIIGGYLVIRYLANK